MHPDDEQIKPARLMYYYAPPESAEVRAHTIEDGIEYVELVTNGGVFFDDGTGERYCGEGSLFWHFPGEQTIHKYKKGKPYECLSVRFYMSAPHRRIAPRLTFLRTPPDAVKISSEYLRAFHDETFDRNLLSKSLHTRLLWEAYNSIRTLPRPGLPRILDEAIEWMEKNYAENISVPETAAHLGVSAPYLYSLFRTKLGESPHQWLLSRRLQSARNRLAVTRCSLKTIAFECGFQNPEHFCRLFRARYGVSPMEYRRQNELHFESGNESN